MPHGPRRMERHVGGIHAGLKDGARGDVSCLISSELHVSSKATVAPPVINERNYPVESLQALRYRDPTPANRKRANARRVAGRSDRNL